MTPLLTVGPLRHRREVHAHTRARWFFYDSFFSARFGFIVRICKKKHRIELNPRNEDGRLHMRPRSCKSLPSPPPLSHVVYHLLPSRARRGHYQQDAVRGFGEKHPRQLPHRRKTLHKLYGIGVEVHSRKCLRRLSRPKGALRYPHQDITRSHDHTG